MAHKINNKPAKHHGDAEEKIENVIYSTESFVIQNGKTLLAILAAVVLLIGGYFGYRYLVAAPRADKAAAAMFVAERVFAEGDYELALTGDGNFEGFEAIISKYGSTPAGNLARHYAGISYLNLGRYDEALSSLKSYKMKKSVPAGMINAQNYGLQGDAYVQMGKYKEAVGMYEQAVSISDNSVTAPYYLKKAGLVYEKLGDNSKALETYRKISIDYAGSLEARDVEKYIGRMEQQ